MPLAAVLFDKDGTFIDFQRTWGPAAFATMQELSAGNAELLARLAEAVHFIAAEKRFRPTSPFIAGSNRDIAALWADILGRSDIAALTLEVGALLRAAALGAIWPIGRPLDVFAALSARGLKLGIATNDAVETARIQVEALALHLHLDFIAGYDSGYGGKPGPGMVHAFAEAVAVPESEIALVGDSTHDLKAARAAGAIAVGVLSGPAERPELEPFADYLIETIDALPELADRLNGVPVGG